MNATYVYHDIDILKQTGILILNIVHNYPQTLNCISLFSSGLVPE